MRICVTGGSGFIGSHVAAALSRRGDSVLVVDDQSGGQNIVENTTLLKANLAIDDLKQITDFGPEICAHLSSNAREGASQFQPAAVTAANTMASARLLEACILGGSLKRVWFTSSMARFGDGDPIGPPFDEAKHRLSPCDVYGWNKVCIEGMIKALSYVHGFAWSICHPHNVIGGASNGGGGQCLRDRYRNVAAITMNRIMRGEPIIVFGDGNQKRAFSPIEDSLPCFIKMIDGAADGLHVNVGGAVPVTINTLIGAIKEDMGVDSAYPTLYLPDRPLEVHMAWCTINRSQQFLGYEENVGWRECIRRMAAWAKSVGPQEWSEEKLILNAPNRPEVWK